MPTIAGIGVLLVNLGTPDAAEPKAVRRYLKEFLSDRRVIEKDTLAVEARAQRYHSAAALAAQGARLRKDLESRKERVAAQDHHPLAGGEARRHSRAARQARDRRLGDALCQSLDRFAAAKRWSTRGCDRILVMPLYPQYAAPTTATVGDEVFRFLLRQRRQPAIRIMPAYYDDPYYIEVLSSSLKAELKALPFAPDVIVASYHGMPQRLCAKGRPYESQCVRTTELSARAAQARRHQADPDLSVALRPGPKWLQPYTIDTVKALAKKGVKNLVVITPGFSADCLETLEEIAVENAHVFKRYGGENFAAIPCLNDSEAGMLMVWQLAMRELKGWV